MEITEFLELPKGFYEIERPKSPVDAVAYGYMSNQVKVNLLAYPIKRVQAMPYDDVELLILRIHQTLEDTQGLVEVGNGITDDGNRYIYSILKSILDSGGTSYKVKLHIDLYDCCLELLGTFNEIDNIGRREREIREVLDQKGWLNRNGNQKWNADPYSSNYEHPILRNFSEKEGFDKHYPGHPLSILRKMVKTVVHESNFELIAR